MVVEAILSCLIGYAFGCIQAAYLLGRWAGGVDIREHGSGNAGASNITSTLGIRYGVIVGLVDVLKGFAAVMVVRSLYPENPDLALLSGLMAIVGHMFPFFMSFRGGKGVAALVGVMLGVDWRLGIIFALLVALPALFTDYIVAGSFATFLALPVVVYLLEYSLFLVLFSLILVGICFYLHRGNISRIRAGEEQKISSVIPYR